MKPMNISIIISSTRPAQKWGPGKIVVEKIIVEITQL